MNNFSVTIDSTPCEHVIIENLYTSLELELIWQEIDFLSTKLLPPDKTGSAKENNNTLKHAGGLFLDDIYASRETSNILQLNRRLWHSSVVEYIEQNLSSWWRLFSMSNKDTTLLNYYSDCDYYKPHIDHSLFTACTTLHKTPLNYIGGDFILLDKVIQLKTNSCIIFPGHLQHGVTPIKLLDTDQKNSGRYSLAQFITINIS